MRLPFLFLLGALAALPARAEEMTKLAVSYSATADFAPDFIAKDAGIFAQHGLDVTLTNLATTSLGPPALMAGSLQLASSSPPLLRSEEHTSELQSHSDLVCRLLLEKKK